MIKHLLDFFIRLSVCLIITITTTECNGWMDEFSSLNLSIHFQFHTSLKGKPQKNKNINELKLKLNGSRIFFFK